MIYRIEAFDQKTELLAFEAQLPEGCDDQIAAVMGWTTEQQGWEGYDLTSDQIAALEKLLGRTVFDPAYLFQLSCNVN
ncbi:hypothetical protein CFN16_10965 [Pseudomonas fluorescens]|uniref:DUF7683 domain-containing protein n=1 Tax=Pseudomonas fluorescens TaxID=294 RepID=A0A345UVX2_PSEFL|nr:hypothetical protein [Pseudomonas fluorescens]AXJ04624.1 hypothetical protein CFN16_10965 [Pseudomonas fluorescens]